MAKDRDVKAVLRRVNIVMDKIEKLLGGNDIPDNISPEVEKDRVAYKEGLVDGLCMMSWVKDVEGKQIDYVGSGEGKPLKDVLEEIGSVFGFDGKKQLERIKTEEVVSAANEKVKVLNGEVKNGDIKVTDIKGEDVESIEEAESKL